MATPDSKDLVRRGQKRVHEMTDHQLQMKIRVFESQRVPSNLPKDRRNMEDMAAAEQKLDKTVKSLRLMANSLNMDARGDLAEEARAAEKRVKDVLDKIRFDIENPTEKSEEEKRQEADEKRKKEEEKKKKDGDRPTLPNVLFEDVHGLWMLPDLCAKLDFQGKGHEAEDLAKLMRTYLGWAREVGKVWQMKNPMAIHIHDFGETCMTHLHKAAENSRAWDLRYEYKSGKRPTTEPEPEAPDANAANAAQNDPGAGGPEDAARAAALARLRAHTQTAPPPHVPTPEERARAAENKRRALELRAAKLAAAAKEAEGQPAAEAAPPSGDPAPMTEEMREQIRQRRLAALAKQAARKAEQAAAAAPEAATAPATVPDTQTLPDTATVPASASTLPDTAPVPASATVPDTAAESGPTQLLDELLEEPLFEEPSARGA